MWGARVQSRRDQREGRAAIWEHWADVAAWPQWNDGIEKLEIHGPFAVGTTFTMTPPGDDPVHMSLTEIRPGELFTDEADGGDFVVRTIHKLEPADDGRTRIVYRTEITGGRPPPRSVRRSVPRSRPTSPRCSRPLAKLAEGAEG